MKVILLISMFFISFSSFSACTGRSCASEYVDRLYVTANGNIYVGSSGDEKLLNCTAVSNVYMTLNPNAGNAEEIYSALLAAQSANKRVTIRISEGSSDCSISYITLDRQ